jgi:23S rRNA pseudouridine955/2504/2580 synthase
VVGDRVYSKTSLDIEVPRIFLHAWRVELAHPTTGDRLAVEAPLPDDLAGVLASLDTELGE